MSLLSEIDEPADRARIGHNSAINTWCARECGINQLIASVKAWNPDIIYVQSDIQPELERRLTEIAPSIFFAHNYAGACISGLKLQRLPSMTICQRALGWRCLLHYYPRRCGGLNPATMWIDYTKQKLRIARFHRYDAVVTASQHMRHEYIRQGFNADRVHVVFLPIIEPTDYEPNQIHCRSSSATNKANRWQSELRLLFVGRMEWTKGGQFLIDALSEISMRLNKRIFVDFVGDGRERARWSGHALKLQSREPGVSFRFNGWLEGAALSEKFEQADLLVVPSLWPEPFGMVGLEAGKYSLPAVAFDVGGISEWLTDGFNGHLAPANPTTPSGLARAVVRVFADRRHYLELCEGARCAATHFGLDAHVSSLIELCSEIGVNKTAEAAEIKNQP